MILGLVPLLRSRLSDVMSSERLSLTTQSKIELWGFPGGPLVKNLPPMQGSRVPSLVWEDPTCHRATAEAHRLHNKRSHHSEKPALTTASTQQRSPNTTKNRRVIEWINKKNKMELCSHISIPPPQLLSYDKYFMELLYGYWSHFGNSSRKACVFIARKCIFFRVSFICVAVHLQWTISMYRNSFAVQSLFSLHSSNDFSPEI